MFILPWFWIWVVLAAALYVCEMLTTSFFLLPFAIGATVSAICALLLAPLWLQWLLFIVISVITLIALRPFARKISVNRPERSGVDRLIGMTGEIIEGDAPSGEQRARIAREVWNVTLVDGRVLAVGALVRVTGVDGVHLIVEGV
ncbi:MAG: NfeD family protein [Coriobacteriales bacterium]|jgi:membrane protein implicated in regulation of membrane protease activity|nr:NfeD family protein [Coriobacteriales bacterium]